MKLLVRYCLQELLATIVVALVISCLILVLAMGMREALRHGLSPGLMLRTMPYLLPQTLAICIPICLLLAITLVFGRMAGTNELLAIKALGISPMVLIIPVLTASVWAGLIVVGLIEFNAVRGTRQIPRLVLQSLAEVAYTKLRVDGAFQSPLFSVVVKRVNGTILEDVVLTIPAREGLPEITITAEEAELLTDLKRNELIVRCRRGEVEAGFTKRARFEDTLEQALPLDVPHQRIRREWLSLAEIPETLLRLEREWAHLRERWERERSSGRPSAALQEQLLETEQLLRRITVEPFRRWANAFSCLSFALVGVPVAISWGKENPLASFFACFVPISILYYPLMMFSENVAVSGIVPPIGVWLGNVLLMVIGGYLLRGVLSR